MRLIGSIGLLSIALASTCFAGVDAIWPFDLETTGQDVTWDSPTPIDPTAGRYRFEYVITLAEADGSLGAFPLGTFDILPMIPPDQLSDVGYAQGPAPVIVWNSSIIAPDLPEAPALIADVQITVDAAGFAHMSMTNVVLGTAFVDAGSPFGIVEIDVTRFQMAGDIFANAIEISSDLNNDCVVDTADLGLLLTQFSSDNEQADINDDDVVDTADLGLLLSQFGMSCLK